MKPENIDKAKDLLSRYQKLLSLAELTARIGDGIMDSPDSVYRLMPNRDQVYLQLTKQETLDITIRNMKMVREELSRLGVEVEELPEYV